MIAFSPAVTPPFSPPNQPIAFASVDLNRVETFGGVGSTGRTVVTVNFFDASMNRVPINTIGLPKVTDAMISTFLAATDSTTTDSLDQRNSRAALPILSAVFGLTNGTVQ